MTNPHNTLPSFTANRRAVFVLATAVAAVLLLAGCGGPSAAQVAAKDAAHRRQVAAQAAAHKAKIEKAAELRVASQIITANNTYISAYNKLIRAMSVQIGRYNALVDANTVDNACIDSMTLTTQCSSVVGLCPREATALNNEASELATFLARMDAIDFPSTFQSDAQSVISGTASYENALSTLAANTCNDADTSVLETSQNTFAAAITVLSAKFGDTSG